MRAACLVLLLVVAVSASGASASVIRSQELQLEYAVATTENGDVRGLVATSLNGTPYKRFVGIPYATPPVGDLRFKAPLPAANWSGVRDALTYGPNCTQSNGGAEDCLYLNVYVPETNDSSPLPVMFHIHGGGFFSGSSSEWTPDYFVENGVILVNCDYRLGAFGFLSLQNDDIPGNAGLKDQVLALQWVQRNIAAFGGDPSRVTIFGESAGGVSTSFLFLSPAAKGLFRGASMQSGVATDPWALQPEPRVAAYQLGAALGFNGSSEDDAALAAFLRAADPADLVAVQVTGSPSGIIPFAPVLEPSSDSAVISELPETILAEGRYNHVPVIIGVTSGEACLLAIGLQFSNEEQAAEARENFVPSVAAQIPLPTEEERIEAAKLVEEFYFGADGYRVNKTQENNDVYSDIVFIRPAYAFARTVVNTSNVPVYFYYFDYDGYGATEYGMLHAWETAYLYLVETDSTSNDWKVAQQMRKVWTNFGKYGDPTPAGSSMTWDRFSADTDSYLDMKLEFVSRQHFLQQRMAFWRDILHQ